MADPLGWNPYLVVTTGMALVALGISIYQARCSTKAQLISTRNLELQEQGAQLRLMDSQYGQHIVAHQAAIEQLRIDVAVLKEYRRKDDERKTREAVSAEGRP